MTDNSKQPFCGGEGKMQLFCRHSYPGVESCSLHVAASLSFFFQTNMSPWLLPLITAPVSFFILVREWIKDESAGLVIWRSWKLITAAALIEHAGWHLVPEHAVNGLTLVIICLTNKLNTAMQNRSDMSFRAQILIYIQKPQAEPPSLSAAGWPVVALWSRSQTASLLLFLRYHGYFCC